LTEKDTSCPNVLRVKKLRDYNLGLIIVAVNLKSILYSGAFIVKKII